MSDDEIMEMIKKYKIVEIVIDSKIKYIANNFYEILKNKEKNTGK